MNQCEDEVFRGAADASLLPEFARFCAGFGPDPRARLRTRVNSNSACGIKRESALSLNQIPTSADVVWCR